MFIFSKFKWKWCWIALSVGISGVILINATVYFRDLPTPTFLLEKGELRFSPLWITAFRFHVISSCVCLALGPLLMIPRLIAFRRFHWLMGYVYLNSVLWIAAPTGLIISPAANGGWLSAAGFAVTGLLWWYATWQGYAAIKTEQLQAHICWMVRSYAIALSAVGFRVIQQGLSLGPLSDSTNYMLSVWLSLIVSLWVSESCIAQHFSKRYPTQGWFSFMNLNKEGGNYESLPGNSVGG